MTHTISMTHYDVIIIGGGFAGISAGRHLTRSGQNIMLLEARDRLGGRVFTKQVLDGIPIDLGGQWIGPTQDHMYALVNEYGLETYPTYDKGMCILDLNEKLSTYTGLIPKMDVLSLLSIELTIRRLDKMARTLDISAPWRHPKAQLWDSMTLGAYLYKTVHRKNALKILTTGLETVLACRPSEVSLLHTLFYIKSGKDINTLLNIQNGAQQDRIKGGMQQIAEHMAHEFQDAVHLGEAVKKVSQNELNCTVITDQNEYHSKKVIIAIPPTLAGQLTYEPQLSVKKRQLLQKLPMGIVVKCYAIYKKAFWRDKGFSGEVVTDSHAPYQTIFDNSAADSDYGVLMGFALAARATNLMAVSQGERRTLMIRTLVKYFGQEAENLWHYEDLCWAEEDYSLGCYAAYAPPGVCTQYRDEIRKPSGHIHWAGTETATEWNGYIEGAVRSGIRAAEEIIRIL